jgi:hypothetical protein
MRPFAAIVGKDLRLFFADRRAVLMSVLAPIVIASFFGFIFDEGGDHRDASRVAVFVDGMCLISKRPDRRPPTSARREARHAGRGA